MLKFSVPLSPQALRIRAIELILFASPLVGAYYYGYGDRSSPLFCPFKALTGIPCPGCGMTRSFMAIATGNFDQALDCHAFGFVLFIGLAIAIVHLSLELLSKRKITALYSQFVLKRKNQLLFILLFLAYYFLRTFNLLKSGELAINFFHSPLGKLIF
jgi:hypothetical protein